MSNSSRDQEQRLFPLDTDDLANMNKLGNFLNNSGFLTPERIVWSEKNLWMDTTSTPFRVEKIDPATGYQNGWLLCWAHTQICASWEEPSREVKNESIRKMQLIPLHSLKKTAQEIRQVVSGSTLLYQSVFPLEVNLKEYPVGEISALEPNTQLTIGDLHANALKLIYFLVREGVLNMTLQDYNNCVAIYCKDVEDLTYDDITHFNEISEGLTATEHAKTATIRLIGDECADRGCNDYFVLKLLEKLGREGIPLEIILSNHGSDFMAGSYEKSSDVRTWQASFIGAPQTVSLTNLARLAQKGFVWSQEVLDLVNDYYKPQLRLLSYSIDETKNPKKITLYSHAPIGFNLIQQLAIKLNIDPPYADESLVALTGSIDRINHAFQEQYIRQNKIQTIFDDPDHPNNPLFRVMWDRSNELSGERILGQYDYQIHYVHGHDGVGHSPDKNLVTNLDNYLGKGSCEESFKGHYSIMRSQERPAPPLLLNTAILILNAAERPITPTHATAVNFFRAVSSPVEESKDNSEISNDGDQQQVNDENAIRISASL